MLTGPDREGSGFMARGSEVHLASEGGCDALVGPKSPSV